MATKNDIVTAALEDIGFDEIDAREVRIGVRELRNFCLSLENSGVNVNYNNTETNAPDEESGISQINQDAIIKNLAVRMAAIVGENISPTYAGLARKLLEGITPFVIPEYEANPFLPDGAGDRLYDYQYFHNEFQYPDEITFTSVGEKVKAEKNLFDDNVDGSIVSTAWEADTSTITITDTQLNGTVAEAMVSFSAPGNYIVKILSTYDSGEIDAKCIKFSVSECRESPNLYRGQDGNRIF